MESKKITSRRGGWLSLGLWALLIASGIVAKRVYGHPDWMVFFHLPAAVFLVLAFYHLSEPVRARHRRYRYRAAPQEASLSSPR